MAHREFDLAVGKLPPILDDGNVTSLRSLIEDFAGFAASSLDGQLEYPRLLRAGHPACQIERANRHVMSPKAIGPRPMPPIMDAGPPNKSLSGSLAVVSWPLSPLITGFQALALTFAARQIGVPGAARQMLKKR
jgi:hypothetical protein